MNEIKYKSYNKGPKYIHRKCGYFLAVNGFCYKCQQFPKDEAVERLSQVVKPSN